MDAITSSNGTLGLLALLATIGFVRVCRPLANGTPSAVPDGARFGGAAVGLAASALLLGIGGHASIETDPSLAVGLDAAHVLAAAAWLGPLALVLAAGRSRPWRALDRTSRSAALQRFFSAYAAVAGWSFAVLVVTGLRPLWLNAASRLTRTDYGLVLLAKLGLVLAVIAPLGWYHDGLVRRRERRAGPPAAAKAVGAPAFGRTLALEAGALVVVLALAAALAGLNPGSRRTATPTTALAASRSAPADQVNGSGL